MQIRSLLTSIALASATVVPAIAVSPTATAAGNVQLSIAGAVGHDATVPKPFTVCIDGVVAAKLQSGQTAPAVSVSSGPHEISAYAFLQDSCEGEPMVYNQALDVPEVAAATLLFYGPVGDRVTDTVLVDDLTCPAPGQGRLVLRHGADNYHEGPSAAVTVRATAPGGGTTVLADLLDSGEQHSADLAPGTYTNVEFTGESDTSILSDSDITVSPGSIVIRTYYGGHDGSIGSFDRVVQNVCGSVVTTTTAPPAPSTTAPPALAATVVHATPKYTG